MDVIPVTIIDSDNNARFGLKSILEEYSFVNVVSDFNNLNIAYNTIMEEKPSVVFIDISNNQKQALQTIEKVYTHLKSCLIIATSNDSNSDLVIAALKAGAIDFLPKPYDPKALKLVFKKIRSLIRNSEEDESSGKIITVFSNKGGIGKTTLATNLAVALAGVTNKRVALVDLNLQLGDVTTFLDITPSFDIGYVSTHLSRIDEAFLLGTLDRYKDKELYVLADPPYLEQAEDITSEQIVSILEILKTVFSYVIVDTTSSFDSKTLSALDVSNSILLLSMINLPSIRNTQRCLDLFNRLDYPENKIKLLINRYLPDDEISTEDVEDALGHQIYWKIPNDYFTVMSAINKGVPIFDVNSSSPISKNFIELASLISNVGIIDENLQEVSSRKKSGFGLNILNKLKI